MARNFSGSVPLMETVAMEVRIERSIAASSLQFGECGMDLSGAFQCRTSA
jgi:hypothetical protein